MERRNSGSMIRISKRKLRASVVGVVLLAMISGVMAACNTGGSAPEANDVQIQATSGEEVSVNVMANDSDPDGGELTLDSVVSPTVNGGTATISGNSVSYTSAPGFTGTDSFSYTISDADGNQATAQVTVIVSAAMEAEATEAPPPTEAATEAPQPVGNTEALPAIATAPVELLDGPSTDCQKLGTWAVDQQGLLLARVENPDGSVYYKAIPPGSSSVAYVAGGTTAYFNITGDPATLPLETGSCGEGSDAAAAQASGLRTSSLTELLANENENCGEYGDGGVEYGDDWESCTYSDEYYDTCGNVWTVEGDLSADYCSSGSCGTYGDGGCEDRLLQSVGEGEACVEARETICYDTCGNAQTYPYAQACGDPECGRIGDGGCDDPVSTQACPEGADATAYSVTEQTCYDTCGNSETYETFELCAGNSTCGVYGDGGCDPIIQTATCAADNAIRFEETCYDLCGNSTTYETGSSCFGITPP